MKFRELLFPILLTVIFLVLVIMHLNNIRLFNTDLGFDGAMHKEYVNWIQKNHSIPLPHQGWEFNQPPLYYLLAGGAISIGINPQIINFLCLLLFAYFVYHFSKSKTALLSVLSLPMLNYFPSLITNEYIGGLFIVVCLLVLLGKPKPVLLGILLALGFYSKYSIITLIPLVPVSYLLYEKNHFKAVIKSFLSLTIFLLLISPIVIRNVSHYGKILPLAPDFFVFESTRQATNLNFFTNLSWIPKLDTFSANKYSFTGGLWDTFWLDGYQIVTPVLTFSTKALLLWILGFPLIVLSLYGLIKIFLRDRRRGIILISYIFLAILSLVKYYLYLPYDFVLKSFYAFGLIIPYSLGLAEVANKNKNIKFLVVFLLLAQFIMMISSFWIQPWWHVVK